MTIRPAPDNQQERPFGESSETARRALARAKIQSDLHGDMQRLAEMTGPPHSGSNNVVYRGGNAYIQFDSKAYKAGSVAAFWPWSSLGTMGTIGVLASSIALGMILSATVGTPAFGFPATLTAPYSILAPNNPARLLFDSRVRNVPVRLLCLPYSSGGIKWYQ